MIKFWKDVWIGEEELKLRFPRLFSLVMDKDLTLSEMKARWHRDQDSMRRRNLRGWEFDSVKELDLVIQNVQLNQTQDMSEWLGNHGQFSTKDLYSKLEIRHQNYGMRN